MAATTVFDCKATLDETRVVTLPVVAKSPQAALVIFLRRLSRQIKLGHVEGGYPNSVVIMAPPDPDGKVDTYKPTTDELYEAILTVFEAEHQNEEEE